MFVPPAVSESAAALIEGIFPFTPECGRDQIWLARVENALRVGIDVDAAHPDGIKFERFFEGGFLSEVARVGNSRDIRRLVEAGADVNYVAPNGTTALFTAISYGRATIVETLLELGADVKGRRGGMLPLTAIGTPNAAITRSLLAAGADLTTMTMQGQPIAFQIALDEGNLCARFADIIDYLPEKPLWNSTGQSLLTMVVLKGSKRSLALLLKRGALRYEPESPFFCVMSDATLTTMLVEAALEIWPRRAFPTPLAEQVASLYRALAADRGKAALDIWNAFQRPAQKATQHLLERAFACAPDSAVRAFKTTDAKLLALRNARLQKGKPVSRPADVRPAHYPASA